MIDEFFDYVAHPMTKEHLPGAPWYLMSVTIVYVVFVVHLGPITMEKRNPFDLKGLIRVYYKVNIVANATWFVLAMFLTKLLRSCWICQPNNVPPFFVLLACWTYMYLKIFDLLDTIFLVLLKKSNEISLLHVSHHIIMPWAAWLAIKYAPMVTTGFTPALNSFVHVIMYTYYYNASQGVQLNWIKQCITSIHLIQFAIIYIHAAHLIFMPNCDYPIWLASMQLSYSLFFTYQYIHRI